MAKTSMKIKQQRAPKFKVQAYTRCERCGRPHSVLRKFKICRICFRELAYKGQIPGVKKSKLVKLKVSGRRFTTHGYVRSNCRYAYTHSQR